jgi:predicted membrane chloride channel (bestrophin family)
MVVVILSVISTYLCIRFKLYADLPLTLIGIAIVFPIVFSIGGAYSRREKALQHYGRLKAHGRSMFLAARDWTEKPDKKFLMRIKRLLRDLLVNCRELFNTELNNSEEREKNIYSVFSKLSRYIKECRSRGMSTSDFSRANQYLDKMTDAFENLKHIYQYRTPLTLRAFSKIFTIILPILYGPYFAYLAGDYSSGLIYIVPILFSIILISLDNIQDHLENPFDLVGEDDVRINVEKFLETLDY